jgi:hypothetical protein
MSSSGFYRTGASGANSNPPPSRPRPHIPGRNLPKRKMSKTVRAYWGAAVVLGDAELGRLPQHLIAHAFGVSLGMLTRALREIRQRQAAAAATQAAE